MKKKVTTTLLVGSLLGFSACGRKLQSSSDSNSNSDIAQGIINGDDVSRTDLIAKTTVIVYAKTPQNTYSTCTGTVIGPNLVVTAAHCTTLNPQDLRIIFSTDIKDRSAPIRKVLGGMTTETFNHFNFSIPSSIPIKNWGDIALLKLEGDTLPDGYAAASLLSTKDFLKSGMTVSLAGYGVNGFKKLVISTVSVGSGVLRTADVSMQDSAYSETEFLVTTKDGKGACHGDSGGPAYVIQDGKVLLLGITSRADSNEAALTCDDGTIYTSVLAQQDFLAAANQFLQSDAFIPGSNIAQPIGN